MSDLDVWGRGFFNLLLRRISERQAVDADVFLQQSGMKTPARSTAVLYYLAKHDGASVVDLVNGVGYTHQGISKIVTQLSKRNQITAKPHPQDQRKSSRHLTKLGKKEATLLEDVVRQAEMVVDQLFDEIGVDLHTALRAFEDRLIEKPLLERFNEAKEKLG